MNFAKTFIGKIQSKPKNWDWNSIRKHLCTWQECRRCGTRANNQKEKRKITYKDDWEKEKCKWKWELKNIHVHARMQKMQPAMFFGHNVTIANCWISYQKLTKKRKKEKVTCVHDRADTKLKLKMEIENQQCTWQKCRRCGRVEIKIKIDSEIEIEIEIEMKYKSTHVHARMQQMWHPWFRALVFSFYVLACWLLGWRYIEQTAALWQVIGQQPPYD